MCRILEAFKKSTEPYADKIIKNVVNIAKLDSVY